MPSKNQAGTHQVFLLGFAALFLSSAMSLSLLPGLLQQGADRPFYQRTNTDAQRYASSPLDVSIISPVEGHGGLSQPIGILVHPGYLPGILLGNWVDPAVANNLAIIACYSLATFGLGRVAGLSTRGAVIAGQIGGIVCFPPIALPLRMCHNFSITSAGLAFPVCMGTCMVVVLFVLGTKQRAVNVLCVLALPSILIYSVICDPLYTSVCMIGAATLLFGVWVSSENRNQFLWRFAGLAACAIVCFATSLHHIYSAYSQYSARVAFPNEIHGGIQQFGIGCAWLLQGRLGPTTFALLTIVGCIVVAVRGTRTQRFFCLAVLAFQLLMIGLTLVYLFAGIRWPYPAPDYFEQGAAPAYFVSIMMGVQILWPSAKDRVSINDVRTVALPVVALLASVILVRSGAPMRYVPPKPTPLTQIVIDDLAIYPNNQFRGSLVTVAGVPGGPLALHMDKGWDDDEPRSEHIFNSGRRYIRTYFGANLWMQDLWNRDVPTLERQSQLISSQRYYLFSRALSRRNDYQFTNYSLVSVARPKLLAALGSRYLLTDLQFPDDHPWLRLRTQITNRERVTIRLYEFTQPNTGNYSPTKIRVAQTADEMIDLMTSKEFSFMEEAIVHQPRRGMPELVPATTGRMFFERGGVRVEASSPGTSLIVLPIEYSHSFKVTPIGDSPKPELLRVNLLQTGVLFSGDINIKIAHVFGLFRGYRGRLRDIADCKSLGMNERDDFPFPTDLLPHAFNRPEDSNEQP